ARCSGKGSTIPTMVVFGSPPRTRAWLVPITPAPITPTRIQFPSYRQRKPFQRLATSKETAKPRPCPHQPLSSRPLALEDTIGRTPFPRLGHVDLGMGAWA